MVKRIKAWRWLRQAHVPVVPGLRLRQGGCQYPGLGITSCYRGGLVIGWEGPLKTEQDKQDLYHEAGHAFLKEWTTDGDREHIKHLAGWPDLPWWWGQMPDPNPGTAKAQPLEEYFADLYSLLARYKQGYPALRALLQSIDDRHARDYIDVP